MEEDYDGPWISIEKRIIWNCPDRKRHNVTLFGSWDRFKGENELEYQGKQRFACTVKLPLGTYVYRFFIDYEDWETNNSAPKTARNGIEYNQISVREDNDSEEDDDDFQENDDNQEQTVLVYEDGKLTVATKKKKRGRVSVELDLAENYVKDEDQNDEKDEKLPKKKKKKRKKKKGGAQQEQQKEWAKYVFTQQLRMQQQHNDEINRVKTLWKQERQVRVEMHKKAMRRLKEAKKELQAQQLEQSHITSEIARNLSLKNDELSKQSGIIVSKIARFINELNETITGIDPINNGRDAFIAIKKGFNQKLDDLQFIVRKDKELVNEFRNQQDRFEQCFNRLLRQKVDIAAWTKEIIQNVSDMNELLHSLDEKFANQGFIGVS